jgi:hypothetical protein
MRILICGAALIALISTAFAAPMTPVPHKSVVTKVGNCQTRCRYNQWSHQEVCDTYCY